MYEFQKMFAQPKLFLFIVIVPKKHKRSKSTEYWLTTQTDTFNLSCSANECMLFERSVFTQMHYITMLVSTLPDKQQANHSHCNSLVGTCTIKVLLQICPVYLPRVSVHG